MKIKKWLLSLTAMLCCLTTALGACGGIYLDSSFSSSSSTTESTSEDSMFSENSSIENSSAESSSENSSVENNSTENSSENSSVEDSSVDSSADSSTDSSAEDAADFPIVNAAELVDVTVDVPVGKEPVVLMLSDTQLIDASQQRSTTRLGNAYSEQNTRWSRGNIEDRLLRYVREAVERSNPDLILLVGDNVYGEFDDSGYALQLFVEFMETFDIPWAPVLGNHDSETAKGIDWLCAQYENAENCLFKRGNLTGNGNYSVGITQGGKLLRTFFMMDTVTNRNGSKRSAYGFAQDEINWYTQKMTAIKTASPQTKLSILTHVPTQVATDVLNEKYGWVKATSGPMDLDVSGRDGDFGIANELAGGWDTDRTIWNGWKALGVDSVFFGHVHGCSVGIQYEGIQIQFGLKTGTYDALNYRAADNSIVWTYGDGGNPITGATVIPVSKTDGSINPYHIQTQLEEDKVFNETLTPLQKDTNVTNVSITTISAYSGSSQNNLYLKFFANNQVQFLDVAGGTNSVNNEALKNFAKQIVFSGTDVLSNVGVITSQQDESRVNAFVQFQLNGGANVKRFQYLLIPAGTTYECDSDGNGKVDTVWTFAKDFKIVYDPAACKVNVGYGGCNGSCDKDEWHIYESASIVVPETTVYTITGGGKYYSTNTNLNFQFIGSTAVDLGYTNWTDPDSDCENFKQHILYNGGALPTGAILQGHKADSLALSGFTMNVGDTITIQKGAVFTHGYVKMVFAVSITWTYNGGNNYTVTITQ